MNGPPPPPPAACPAGVVSKGDLLLDPGAAPCGINVAAVQGLYGVAMVLNALAGVLCCAGIAMYFRLATLRSGAMPYNSDLTCLSLVFHLVSAFAFAFLGLLKVLDVNTVIGESQLATALLIVSFALMFFFVAMERGSNHRIIVRLKLFDVLRRSTSHFLYGMTALSFLDVILGPIASGLLAGCITDPLECPAYTSFFYYVLATFFLFIGITTVIRIQTTCYILKQILLKVPSEPKKKLVRNLIIELRTYLLPAVKLLPVAAVCYCFAAIPFLAHQSSYFIPSVSIVITLSCIPITAHQVKKFHSSTIRARETGKTSKQTESLNQNSPILAPTQLDERASSGSLTTLNLKLPARYRQDTRELKQLSTILSSGVLDV